MNPNTSSGRRAPGARSLLGLTAGLVCALALLPASPAAAADTTPPVISSVQVGPVTATTAVVTWTTNEAADSKLVYGRTLSYGNTRSLSTLATSHKLTMYGLTAGITYHVQARSADAAGNLARSSDQTFTTTGGSAPGFNPGNPNGTATVPSGAGLEDVSHPDHVIGTGTPASCTSAAVAAAVTAGGVITFSCGSAPVTITLTQTLRVRNSTARVVLDGGGLVTLSGARTNRILYLDTCDRSLGSVSGNCLYAPTGPALTVQNLTLANGNATNASYVSPGDDDQGSNGGGAIFALGGRLKVVRSVFTGNVCAANGPDLGGGAIRVLAQHSATPDDLDNSSAARNQDPVTIVQSTFGGAPGLGNSCSNGGAVSTLRTPLRMINSLVSYNSAIGCCSNPANAGTPGGGSGGASYSDDDSYTTAFAGDDIEHNSARAGGSAIFYVSNDKTGHLTIDRTVSRNNTYDTSGRYGDQHFQNYPGIFYLGNGAPVITNSTVQ